MRPFYIYGGATGKIYHKTFYINSDKMSGIITALVRCGRCSIMLEMFLRSPQIGGTVAALLVASLPAANAADGSLQVRIDASKPGAPVTRYEYCMFIEPIGTLMARRL
jgi:hypothetical protein